jgi:hypothetical protein
MALLKDIGKKYGTDKVDEGHTFFKKNFMEIYEKYFEELRMMPIRFLEIGVLNGSSLYSWREYFPNAEIHGMDINPNCKRFERPDLNVFVHTLDCSNEEALKNFAEQYKNYFDIILDDGAHINNITLKTFRNFYSAVKSNGYYIIEDFACIYLDKDFENHVKHWPGCNLIQFKEKINDPEVFFNLLKEIHTGIDLCKWKPEHLESYRPTYNLEYLHHYPSIILMKKNEMYKDS